MNVILRWHGGTTAICLILGCLVTGGPRVAAGQTRCDNPLRPARQRVTDEGPAVQQAVASEPVRAATTPDARIARRIAARSSQPAHRTVSYGSRAPRPAVRGFVPRHELTSAMQVTDEVVAEPIEVGEPGDFTLGQFPSEDGLIEDDCCGEVGGTPGCGGCGSCNGCLIPCPTLALDNFEFFAGVQGFTAPPNRGESGSFGFHYGVNWAAPVPCMLGQPFGMQVGWRGTSTNYSGASFTEDSRNQSFLTAGLFRRVDWGLQGGVVVDFLNDNWYYGDINLTQVRGELSWVYPQCHELGFWFAASTKTSSVESQVLVNGQRRAILEDYESTDLMAFFYRRRFEAVGGGYGRLYAGFTGSSEGLLGADFKLPLTESWALQSGFTYLIPQDGNNRVAYRQEAWNVGVTLVWYPGRRKAIGNDYFRPLFDVADNGNFILRRL